MLITVEDLQKFTSVIPDDEYDLQDIYVGSAIDAVVNYLGYNPESAEYTKHFDGDGTGILYLPHMHVTEVTSVSIDDTVIDNFIVDDNKIVLRNGIFTKGYSNIEVSYSAGWNDTNMPYSIKHAALRIAGLMQQEGQNNIGLTGKTIPNEGSRTFYNFTSYNKYLLPISAYKLVR